MWRFVYTDNKFVPQGEILNMYDVKVVLPLSKLDTLSFRIRLDNPHAAGISNARGNIQGWYNNALQFYGPVITAEETGDSTGAYVAVNAAGAGWTLTKRLVRIRSDVSHTPLPISSILSSMIVRTNLYGSDENTTVFDTVLNNSGIMVTPDDEIPNDVTATGSVALSEHLYRPIMSMITELSHAAPGFEWRILPINNVMDSRFGTPVPKIGKFVAAPVIGSTIANAVFEWGEGTRNNVSSYKRTTTREQQANKVTNFTSFGPLQTGYPIVLGEDGASISEWGVLEDTVASELIDTTYRQGLVDAHVRVRKNPKQTLEFTPQIDPATSGRVPIFAVDFNVGDSVIGRARFEGSMRFNSIVRVWAVQFERDNNATERMTVTLVEDS